MSKTFTLSIQERTVSLRLMNEVKANIETLAFLLEDAKKLAITDDEWTESKRVITTNADQSTTWNWDDTIVMKEVELAQQTVDALHAKIQEKSSGNELTIQDIAVIELDKKLTS